LSIVYAGSRSIKFGWINKAAICQVGNIDTLKSRKQSLAQMLYFACVSLELNYDLHFQNCIDKIMEQRIVTSIIRPTAISESWKIHLLRHFETFSSTLHLEVGWR
jgi:hypothetical protein